MIMRDGENVNRLSTMCRGGRDLVYSLTKEAMDSGEVKVVRGREYRRLPKDRVSMLRVRANMDINEHEEMNRRTGIIV